ncbi:family 16 glycosylhydrolase [Massilia sp. CCM 8734]|uniref:carbohydrate-binding protein n=1 Tax=Massilia sp. CCM 8734 TaxID=2609283 RepID=UPI00142290B0|nr:family 16 glycosylhydrolase [Massilia sp. CCM 8734]NIA00308.1 family 16 glycosylhydrolase [Massilia sp. CCM 8734]
MKTKTINVLLASALSAGAIAGCGDNAARERVDGGQAPVAPVQTATQAGSSANIAAICILQAENYSDAFDTTAGNTGNQYRADNVDIEATSDAGGGYDVGWTANGEWLAHNNITFPTSGAYTFAYRVAAPSAGGVISTDLNGGTIPLGSTSVPATGGWQNWTTVQRTININAGTYNLGTFISSAGFNLNWISIAGASCGTAPLPDGWTLAWADEFNGTSLDTSKWNIEVNGDGGGNNELQYYTARSENIRVTGGELVIQARKEAYMGKQYTSGRITTQNKASWQYGRIEARMKIPTGKGTWPAFWMLGNSINSARWPASGEIDIMEHINSEAVTHGTIHWSDQNNAYANYGGPSGNLDFSQYHVYAVEWDASMIRWYVDGNKFHEVNIAGGINGTSEFHAPFFLLFNLAVGGNWPGSPDGSTAFPNQMQVDYVRVYRR